MVNNVKIEKNGYVKQILVHNSVNINFIYIQQKFDDTFI